jgi:hypothetical protein
VTGLLALAVISPAAVAAAPQRNSLLAEVPVAGELVSGGAFEGIASITGVALNSAGDLVFSGVLNGTATPTGGSALEIVDVAFQVVGQLANPADGGTCDILFLDLAPISLNLLGLTVDLSQVVLDVNAEPGPGNLLGNLLCAVTGLLDGDGPLTGVTNLLRRITSLLG